MTLPLFDGSVIEAGRSLRDMDERLAAYTRLFLVFLAAVLTLGAGAGYLVAWRLTSGIERVSDAARRIADGDLSQRVGAKHESDEIDRLVDAFNAMSENNEALVTELRHRHRRHRARSAHAADPDSRHGRGDGGRGDHRRTVSGRCAAPSRRSATR